MTQGTDEFSLVVELREAKESASALYQGFQIDLLSTTSVLKVASYDDSSSAGNSLTLSANLQASCTDIHNDIYIGFTSCHSVNLFGEYESSVEGAGIHWDSWLGMKISLDEIELKFRKRHCA